MSKDSKGPKPQKPSPDLRYQLFPRSVGLSQTNSVLSSKCLNPFHSRIKSPENTLSSDGVLQLVRPGLERLGFRIESAKTKAGKIPVPVLFGVNNRIDRLLSGRASGDGRIVLEVEAGRAVINFQF